MYWAAQQPGVSFDLGSAHCHEGNEARRKKNNVDYVEEGYSGNPGNFQGQLGVPGLATALAL